MEPKGDFSIAIYYIYSPMVYSVNEDVYGVCFEITRPYTVSILTTARF